MKNTIPDTMQAVQVLSYGTDFDSLQIAEVPTPKPGRGQVLIKVTAAPINPSDLLFIRGQYGIKRPTPTIPGFEGAGIVVAAGPGPFGKRLIGKRVACPVPQDSDGSWAEYVICIAMQCIKLPSDISDEQGAMLLANPMTAIAILDEAKTRGHQAMIHTAAASALGRVLLHVSNQANYPVIHIVRREEQVNMLKAQGGKYILSSSEPDFQYQLKELAGRLKATIAFDAVSGEITGQLIDCMPTDSSVLIYGLLSSAPMPIDPHQLIFYKKQVEGFWLPNWIQQRGVVKTILTIRKAIKLVRAGFSSQIAEKVPLNAIYDAIAEYERNMTRGKVLLVP